MNNPKASTLAELAKKLESDQNLSAQLSDIASDTLEYLKQQNPQRKQAIEALSAADQPERFELITTAAVFTAIAVLLRTHIKIKRDTKGNWSFSLEHKAIESKLLSGILKKLNGLDL